jgi:hypothetical protein
MKTLHLRVTVITGNDDLRGGSWADFLLKIEGNPTPLEQRQFTGTGGLGARSSVSIDLRFSVPDDFEPHHIENFQIRHVSQEGFLQTADNWDLRLAVVDIIPTPKPNIRIGATGNWRFDGSHRVLSQASSI